MFQLIFYVPESHLETVKKAVFNTGAGRYNNYDSCCWQVEGIGQFRPADGSSPFIGKQGSLEKVPEYRVEMVVEDSLMKKAAKALVEAHPYEEPAYLVLKNEI